jgi:hypothetical protein
MCREICTFPIDSQGETGLLDRAESQVEQNFPVFSRRSGNWETREPFGLDCQHSHLVASSQVLSRPSRHTFEDPTLYGCDGDPRRFHRGGRSHRRDGQWRSPGPPTIRDLNRRSPARVSRRPARTARRRGHRLRQEGPARCPRSGSNPVPVRLPMPRAPSLSRSRIVANTRQPRMASAIAVARPMPLDVPVMTTLRIRPCSIFACGFQRAD